MARQLAEMNERIDKLMSAKDECRRYFPWPERNLHVKGFGSTLIGLALRWYFNLPNGSIASFEKLVETFMVQFSSSKKIPKRSDDLYRLPQKRKCLSYVVIQEPPSKRSKAIYFLVENYMRNSPSVMSDRDNSAYVRSEEEVRRTSLTPTKEERREDKCQRKEQSGASDSNGKRPCKSERTDYDKNCPEYPLWIAQVEAMADIGHTTPDCKVLRYEVTDLLKKGHLRNLLSEKVLVFVEDEAIELLHPHQDALVVTLQIANYNVKRILVYNGSSTNVMLLEAYKGMDLDETLIVRRSTTLVRFNDEKVVTKLP
ncbi:uncharacterized protein LOC119996965 [Tripterygium wilfordii]|uniref:uncharacterized protein LOC119996965 n=1 Tax=Tripterygium wilfordii TaxID=458696 RepID=UPI0018F85886|nr:uncharacterized protein LOC119996965 [Tripterygium wilfordii]